MRCHLEGVVTPKKISVSNTNTTKEYLGRSQQNTATKEDTISDNNSTASVNASACSIADPVTAEEDLNGFAAFQRRFLVRDEKRKEELRQLIREKAENWS